MYQSLKNLSASQQVGALFFLVFGLLTVVTAVLVVLSLREPEDEAVALLRRKELSNADGVLRTSWVMGLVFWVGWLAGDRVALLSISLQAWSLKLLT